MKTGLRSRHADGPSGTGAASRRRLPALLTLSIGFLSSGCGLYGPEIYGFSGEKSAIEINDIINKIACELEDAVRYARYEHDLAWLEKWSAKVNLKITLDDNLAVNPGVTTKDIMNPALVTFTNGAKPTFMPQMFSLSIGGRASTKETKTETYEFFFIFGEEFFGPHKLCDPKAEAAPIDSTIGLKEWLDKPGLAAATPETLINHFGEKGAFNVLSKEFKFVVTYSGGVTPQWTLVDLTASSTSPLLYAAREKTDYLLITMGPLDELTKRKPIPAVDAAHLAAMIGQEVSTALRGD